MGSAVQNLAGIIEQIDLAGGVLCVPAVELEHALDGTEGGHVHKNGLSNDVEVDSLRTGGSGQRTRIAEDIRVGDVRLETGEVQRRSGGSVASLGDIAHVGECSTHNVAGGFRVGSNLDHETNDGNGFVYIAKCQSQRFGVSSKSYETLTISLHDKVDFHRIELAVDAVLAGSVKVELLEGVVLVSYSG